MRCGGEGVAIPTPACGSEEARGIRREKEGGVSLPAQGLHCGRVQHHPWLVSIHSSMIVCSIFFVLSMVYKFNSMRHFFVLFLSKLLLLACFASMVLVSIPWFSVVATY